MGDECHVIPMDDEVFIMDKEDDADVLIYDPNKITEL